MGSLAAPSGSVVYLDANSIIYSVERIAPYHALLQPIWQGAATGMHLLMTSGLSP